MAIESLEYRVTGLKNPYNNFMVPMEMGFILLFFIEFIVKVIGMGFWGKNAYIAEGWNRLDLFVVIGGLLTFIPGMPDVTPIKIIRISRILRSVKAIKGLTRLIDSLVNSFKSLANVLGFLLFVIFIFGIFGIQLFVGKLEERCRLTETPIDDQWVASDETLYLCGAKACPEGLTCGNP